MSLRAGGARIDILLAGQHVNACHGRFKNWLRHFNDVATSYLENYLVWRWAIDGDRIGNAERFLRAALGHFNS